MSYDHRPSEEFKSTIKFMNIEKGIPFDTPLFFQMHSFFYFVVMRNYMITLCMGKRKNISWVILQFYMNEDKQIWCSWTNGE